MNLERLLIPGEDLAQLRQLAQDLTDTWRPADLKEKPFVEQLIYHNWLAERMRTVDAKIWAECAPERAEKRSAAIQRMIAVHERAISRATRDLIYLQKLRAKQTQLSKQTQLPEQSQFEAEIASWTDPDAEEQSQIEYPPVPKGANPDNFPTPWMKQQADWCRFKK